MKLIIGLGNPGPAYRNTRHNVGFLVLDRLADGLGTAFTREKYKGLIAEATHEDQKIMLLKPLTYMNRSGESVAMAARNRVQELADILVIYDDIELPLGKIRIRKSGSPGTHNGMKSVTAALGSREVPRMRLGVGDERHGELADHVLAPFKPDEREDAQAMVVRAAEAALCWAQHGIDTVMNKFNR